MCFSVHPQKGNCKRVASAGASAFIRSTSFLQCFMRLAPRMPVGTCDGPPLGLSSEPSTRQRVRSGFWLTGSPAPETAPAPAVSEPKGVAFLAWSFCPHSQSTSARGKRRPAPVPLRNTEPSEDRARRPFHRNVPWAPRRRARRRCRPERCAAVWTDPKGGPFKA